MVSKLVICPNHIGNIQDIPQRSVAALQSADFVLCEDTRTSARLFKELGIGNKLISYHNHNERERINELKAEIDGQSLTIALLSESGMPLVSDPGYRIVKLFHDMNFPIEVIPGPSAFLAALVMSGFPLQSFKFIGFWPKKKKAQTEIMEEVLTNGGLVCFYESPYRVVKTLEQVAAVITKCEVFVVRELTKKYQEYWRGNLDDVLPQMKDKTLKGEFSIVLYNSAKISNRL